MTLTNYSATDFTCDATGTCNDGAIPEISCGPFVDGVPCGLLTDPADVRVAFENLDLAPSESFTFVAWHVHIPPEDPAPYLGLIGDFKFSLDDCYNCYVEEWVNYASYTRGPFDVIPTLLTMNKQYWSTVDEPAGSLLVLAGLAGLVVARRWR